MLHPALDLCGSNFRSFSSYGDEKNYLRRAIIFIFGNAQLTFYHQYKNQCMLLILEVFFLIFTHHDAKPRFPLLIKYYDTTDLDKNADIYIRVLYVA